MNEKGFTLVELVVTLAIASVLIILFMNIGMIIRNIYSNYDSKTTLLIEQGNLSKAIHSKLDKNIISYARCIDNEYFCFDFNLSDGSKSRLLVSDDLISFDNYKYKISDDLIVETSMSKQTLTGIDVIDNNSFFNLKISIKSKIYGDEEFGINYVYQYNSNITNLES